MQVGDKVKIKNPSFPFQTHLRYVVTKVLKTVVHCYEVENPNYIYKNIPKRILSIV